MKRLALFLPLFLIGIATSAQAVTVYDFAAQGNHIENAYASFDINPLVNPDSIQPDGIVISASNGGGLPACRASLPSRAHRPTPTWTGTGSRTQGSASASR